MSRASVDVHFEDEVDDSSNVIHDPSATQSPQSPRNRVRFISDCHLGMTLENIVSDLGMSYTVMVGGTVSQLRHEDGPAYVQEVEALQPGINNVLFSIDMSVKDDRFVIELIFYSLRIDGTWNRSGSLRKV